MMTLKQTPDEMFSDLEKFKEDHDANDRESPEYQLDRIERMVEEKIPPLQKMLAPYRKRGWGTLTLNEKFEVQRAEHRRSTLLDILALSEKAKEARESGDCNVAMIACLEIGKKWGEACSQYRAPMLDKAGRNWVEWRGVWVELPAKEKAIINYLQGRASAPREEVFEAVWGREMDTAGSGTLKSTIQNLRNHLDEAGIPVQIVTIQKKISLKEPDLPREVKS